MNRPIHVVGDIHGQMAQLEHALDLIAIDGGEDAEIVFLGDLVDRGPDSRAVIERLIRGRNAGRNWHVLMGNHDRMFARFLAAGHQHDARIQSGLGWLHPRIGGLATLTSYGIADPMAATPARLREAACAAIPDAHLDFVEELDLYLERGPLLFVHAGIRPGLPLRDQTEDDLIWIREPFLSHTGKHPWLVVHGHTALDRPHHFGNRVDLDGGAGYGRPLVPAVFEGTDCWLLTDGGRIPLLPGQAVAAP